MTELEQMKEENILWDIKFSITNLEWAKIMYQKHAFGERKEMFEDLIMFLSECLRKEVNEYESKYGKKPSIN